MSGKGPRLAVASELAACDSVLQKEGEFTLHCRAILEMEQYIRETYPDAVKVCNICHSLLIQVPSGAPTPQGSLQALFRTLPLGPGLRHTITSSKVSETTTRMPASSPPWSLGF